MSVVMCGKSESSERSLETNDQEHYHHHHHHRYRHEKLLPCNMMQAFYLKTEKIYLMLVFEVCRWRCYPLVLWFGDIKCSRPTSCRKLKQIVKDCQEFFPPTMITNYKFLTGWFR